MYAHQVIEDLNEWVAMDAPIFKLSLLRSLKRSTSFHLDEPGNILDLVNNSESGRPLFTNWPVQYYEPPYDACWIDWCFDDGEKNGALVTKEDDRVVVWPFFYFREIRAWRPAASGTGYDRKTGKTFGVKVSELHYPDKYDDKTRPDILAICNVGTIVEMTLMLLNCKNVETGIIKASDQLNKKRRRTGKQEIFDYRILNVVLPSDRRQYRKSTEPQSHNRVHLCRGHFKQFTPEHPLFGKLSGLYWWQPHVRGQNKKGIVIKDYSVEARA